MSVTSSYDRWLKGAGDKPSEKVNTLSGLDIDEVSLVDAAANGRKFLVVKNHRSEKMPTGQEWLNEATGRALAGLDELTKRIAAGDTAAISGFIVALRKGADDFEFDSCAFGLIDVESVRKGRSLAAAVMRAIEKKAKADGAERLVVMVTAGKAAKFDEAALKKLLSGEVVKTSEAQLKALEKSLGVDEGALIKAAQRDGTLEKVVASTPPAAPAVEPATKAAQPATASNAPSAWLQTFASGMQEGQAAILAEVKTQGDRLGTLEKAASSASSKSASQLVETIKTQAGRIDALEKGVAAPQSETTETTNAQGDTSHEMWPYDLNSEEEKVTAPQSH